MITGFLILINVFQPRISVNNYAYFSCPKNQIQIDSSKNPVSPYYYEHDTTRLGLGKFYLGREIPRLGIQKKVGHKDVDAKEFLKSMEEDRGPVVDSLQIGENMTIADIGCGNGAFEEYFRFKIKTGLIYAEEINNNYLSSIGRRFFFRGELAKIRLIPGTRKDIHIKVPLDLVFLSDVYHELEFPVEILNKIRKVLKPNGTLALLEFKEDSPDYLVGTLHKISPNQAIKELEANGFKFQKTIPFTHQNLILFSPN